MSLEIRAENQHGREEIRPSHGKPSRKRAERRMEGVLHQPQSELFFSLGYRVVCQLTCAVFARLGSLCVIAPDPAHDVLNQNTLGEARTICGCHPQLLSISGSPDQLERDDAVLTIAR
jgi:hypothetical protein